MKPGQKTAIKPTAQNSASAGRKPQDDARKVQQDAKAMAETARDAALDAAEAANETLSGLAERLTTTLRQAPVSEGLANVSAALRQRSVADLTSDVTAMARRHPGAFMAAAAIAGFAAARFVQSSARRRADVRGLRGKREQGF